MEELDNFNRAFDKLIGHEGGFTLDKRDKGNWTGGGIGVGELNGTKYGISAMSYPKVDIKNLTLEDAKSIYYKDFWLRCSCNLLVEPVAFLVFDMAVNSGALTSIRMMQLCVSQKEDGLIGNKTINSLFLADAKSFCMLFTAKRLLLVSSLSSFNTYGRGWTVRNAKNLEFVAGMMSNKIYSKGCLI